VVRITRNIINYDISNMTTKQERKWKGHWQQWKTDFVWMEQSEDLTSLKLPLKEEFLANWYHETYQLATQRT